MDGTPQPLYRKGHYFIGGYKPPMTVGSLDKGVTPVTIHWEHHLKPHPPIDTPRARTESTPLPTASRLPGETRALMYHPHQRALDHKWISCGLTLASPSIVHILSRRPQRADCLD